MSGWVVLGFGQVDAINGVPVTGPGRQSVTALGNPILGVTYQDAVGITRVVVGVKPLSSRIGDRC